MRPLVRLALLVASCSCAVACRPQPPAVPPARVHQTAPKSTLMPQADELVAAMAAGDVARVRASMAPELRRRVRLEDLEMASLRLRRHYGTVVGLLEESMHREGDLIWYSGLFLHAKDGPDPEVGCVLYQFALTPDQQFARLLVREHWFVELLEQPSDHYQPVTRFHFPAPGVWTIIHGGPRRSTNYHHDSTTQRYAYDIIVKKNGRSRRPGSNKRRNDAYYAHGQPLLAPAAGTIVRAVDGVAENVPGERGRAGGNGVVIDHGFGEYSHLWHMIPGSLRVREGDRVETGQQLGLVGNSGRSTMPHIHFHVQSKKDKHGAVGLPAPFIEVYHNGRWTPRVMPVRGDEVRRPKKAGRSQRVASTPMIWVDV